MVITEESKREQPSELEEKSDDSQTLNMDEFKALDNKIKSRKSNDAEEDRFEELVRLYAQE